MDLESLGYGRAYLSEWFSRLYGRLLSVVSQATGGKIMPVIIGFLATTLGRWAGICGIGLVAWFGFASHYKKVGAERVTAQVEKATNEAVSNAASAGNKSADPQSRGVPNPRYRD